MGSETTIGAFDAYDPDGVPEFARMRRATQDADNIDQWCAVMKTGNTGGYANAWLLGDIRTGEIARLELGQRHVGFEADHLDMAQDGKVHAGGRSLCAHCDLDPEGALWSVPFTPAGTVDAKVLDTTMARRMSFAARYGSGCGAAFSAPAFLKAHPQFEWIKDIMPSRASQPWVDFTAGETR